MRPRSNSHPQLAPTEDTDLLDVAIRSPPPLSASHRRPNSSINGLTSTLTPLLRPQRAVRDVLYTREWGRLHPDYLRYQDVKIKGIPWSK